MAALGSVASMHGVVTLHICEWAKAAIRRVLETPVSYLHRLTRMPRLQDKQFMAMLQAHPLWPVPVLAPLRLA